jgi:hypothetical protein
MMVFNYYDFCVYHYTEVSFQVQRGMMFLQGLDIHDFLTCITINTHAYHFELSLHCVGEAQGNGFALVLSNPTIESHVSSLLLAMAPVVRIEPNGVQTLLSFDNDREDLERNGWRVFVEKFRGF